MIKPTKGTVLVLLMAGFCNLAGAQDLVIPGKTSELKQTLETKTEVTLRAPDQSNRCEVDLELEYKQMDTEAEVTTYASVPGCSHASGPYRLHLTYIDNNDESHSVEHDEEWSLLNNGVATKQYSLAEDVYLTRVYVRRVRCECAAGVVEP
ncbi:MAG: hypothetical protein AAF438_04085 [Pseudomonadota bacterium]